MSNFEYTKWLLRYRLWLGILDQIGHALHFPEPIMNKICSDWDRYLGVEEDELRRK